MNGCKVLVAMIMLLGVHAARAEGEQPPAAAASAQGGAQGQAAVSAGREGANASAAGSGSAGAAGDGVSAGLAPGTEISATLAKPVDAGKARPGDAVSARAANDVRSGGQVVVPRGARLIGRVTRARPHGDAGGGPERGDASSQLAIVFERAVLRDGRTVALDGAVTALAAARAAAATGDRVGSGGLAAGGPAAASGGGLAGTVGGVAGVSTGAIGSVGATAGGVASAAARSANAVGGLDVAGGLRSGSRGVFGLHDVEIATIADGGAGGSVISSARRNVRLESGTQMLIVAGAHAARSGAEPAGSESTAGAAREAREDTR